MQIAPVLLALSRSTPWLLLLCSAYFVARGTSALVADELSPDLETLVGAPPLAPAAAAPARPDSNGAHYILERNPFDSVTGRLDRTQQVVAEQPNAADWSDPLRAPRCDGIHVYATTESDDPRWSTAIIQGPGDKRGLSRRAGDAVADLSVVYIGSNPLEASPAVWLADSSRLCQSVLFDPSARSKPGTAHAGAKPAAPLPPRAPGTMPRELSKKIAKTGEGEYAVDRSAVDVIMSNYTSLMRGTRMMPVQKDGHVTGLRLFGIRRGSLLSILGVQNGDEIRNINGFALSSPDKALEAYARLRTASSIRLEVLRGGHPFTIDYAIK